MDVDISAPTERALDIMAERFAQTMRNGMRSTRSTDTQQTDANLTDTVTNFLSDADDDKKRTQLDAKIAAQEVQAQQLPHPQAPKK